MLAANKDATPDFSRAVIDVAKLVVQKEIDGIRALLGTMDENFAKAAKIVARCDGKVVACGVGKSGHIARKISATLASTGTPSVFVHPTEASHGDMGMISQNDVALLLSNSGETREMEDVIAYCKRFAVPMIGVVRRPGSMLAKAADFPFILPEIPEVTPINAPTTSTTMMLVWGDALAVALMEIKGFTKHDFGVLHPGGKLGSRLKKVEDLMARDAGMPLVRENDSMSSVLVEMTKKSLGCAVVTNDKGAMTGLITDGDLRRHMSDDLVTRRAIDIMYRPFIYVASNALAAEALHIMSEKKITNMPVSDDGKRPLGVIHVQALLSAGVY
ncbi:MAG: KpsF/GutQ family sugar-phosphate isomerase [Rickettsiales bacterium]